MKFIIIFKEDKEIIELPASDVSLDQGFSGYTAIDDWERLDQMQLVPCRAYYNDDVFNAEILQVASDDQDVSSTIEWLRTFRREKKCKTLTLLKMLPSRVHIGRRNRFPNMKTVFTDTSTAEGESSEDEVANVSTCTNDVTEVQLPPIIHEPQNVMETENIKENLPTKKTDGTLVDIAASLRVIARKVANIEARQNAMQKSLNDITNQLRLNVHAESSASGIERLTRIETEEEFNDFLLSNKDPNEREKTINQLSRIGGNGARESVRRLLYSLMSVELLSTHSRTGKKSHGVQKKSFKEMEDLVKSALQGRNFPHKDIEEAVSLVLHDARDREGGRNKRRRNTHEPRVVQDPTM